jgi:predicted nuclease of predicted toxin-antitoxin system
LKLLLDEMFSPDLAMALRRRGHDVVAVVERADLASGSDDTVFAAAILETRAVVTNDVEDFVPLFNRAIDEGRDHHGILLTSDRSLSRAKKRIGALLRALDRFLREHPRDDQLRNTLLWLS